MPPSQSRKSASALTEVATDTGVRIERPVPILRIFDVGLALEFYCGYLGFQRDWEHRFDPDSPA